MPWTDLLNHHSQFEQFRHALRCGHLGNTYLFVGPPGIGKRYFAKKLAQALLCEQPPDWLECCQHCPGCNQVKAGSHPDLIEICKPPDRANIPVELFIGDREHRRRVGLIHDIGLKPFRGGKRIAIIDDADYLDTESANSLLKTLEEPPPQSVLILIGTSQQQQLPTILSRSQIIRFQPLSSQQIEQLLRQQDDLSAEIPMEQVATASGGSMEMAKFLAQADSFEFRTQLYNQLATADPIHQEFSKVITQFVDAASSESAVKRSRLNLVGELIIRLFQHCLSQLANDRQAPAGDPTLQQCGQRLLTYWGTLPTVDAMGCCANAIDRTLEFQAHIDANVSAANAIDSLLIDLGRVIRSKLSKT